MWLTAQGQDFIVKYEIPRHFAFLPWWSFYIWPLRFSTLKIGQDLHSLTSSNDLKVVRPVSFGLQDRPCDVNELCDNPPSTSWSPAPHLGRNKLSACINKRRVVIVSKQAASTHSCGGITQYSHVQLVFLVALRTRSTCMKIFHLGFLLEYRFEKRNWTATETAILEYSPWKISIFSRSTVFFLDIVETTVPSEVLQ